MNQSLAIFLSQFYSNVFTQPCMGYYEPRTSLYHFTIGTKDGNKEIILTVNEVSNVGIFKLVSNMYLKLKEELYGKEEK